MDPSTQPGPASPGHYTEEVLGLQHTLRDLGVGDSTEARPTQQTDLGDDESEELSDDFVPLHLVSVSPGRHSGFGNRRRSDPGRMPHYGLRSPWGSSDSSEDDEVPERNPRARSPRRMVTEDECYPSIHVVALEGRLPQGFVSPRRRLYQATKGGQTFIEEMPRRGRTMRSQSLPLPDRAVFGVGEAIGALASSGRSSPDTLSPQARQGHPKRAGRCLSTEEPHHLEAILEEAGGAQKQLSLRRFSAPSHPHRYLKKVLP